MSRPSTPGTTRLCPHCRTTILESSSICPICRKYLRVDPGGGGAGGGAAVRVAPTSVPLLVEGLVRHPDVGEAWEYSVVVVIKNEKGDEMTRHVVGVGAIQPSEARSFSFAVEVFAPSGAKPA